MCCGSDNLTVSPEHFWQTQTQCLRNALSKVTKCRLISTAKSASGSSTLDSWLGSSRGRTRRLLFSCSKFPSSCITSSHCLPRFPRRVDNISESSFGLLTIRRSVGYGSGPGSWGFCFARRHSHASIKGQRDRRIAVLCVYKYLQNLSLGHRRLGHNVRVHAVSL